MKNKHERLYEKQKKETPASKARRRAYFANVSLPQLRRDAEERKIPQREYTFMKVLKPFQDYDRAVQFFKRYFGMQQPQETIVSLAEHAGIYAGRVEREIKDVIALLKRVHQDHLHANLCVLSKTIIFKTPF